jgi:phosphopantetheinyl transferase (holo-ACP synthase)
MRSGTKTIRSVLVTLDIKEVQHDPLLDTYFSAQEQVELSTRHIRSTVGSLALKRAVLHLLSKGKDDVLTEKDIVLGRRPNDRPVLLLLPDHPGAALSNSLFLSISHTRSTAYGLAALQED